MFTVKQYLSFAFYAALFLGAMLLGVQSCTKHFQHERAKDRDVSQIIQNKDASSVSWMDNAQHWHHRSDVASITEKATLKMLSANSEEMKLLKCQVLGLKKDLRNLVDLSKTGSRSSYSIYAGLKDTSIIYLKDTTQLRIATVNDKDGWYRLKALVLKDTLIADIETRDSLVSTVYWNRKWMLGRKHYQHEIISHNPHSKITYDKSLIFIKR